MSINLIIKATHIRPTKGSKLQTIYFNCQQTPTQVTDTILNSSNKEVSYIDWVLSQATDENIDWGVSHIKEFKRWLKKCSEEGYVIEYYAQ